MANIVIKELESSDRIVDLVEKINFNFDQLILGGGGPLGPKGDEGPQGIQGPKGDKGTKWFTDGDSLDIRPGDLILKDDGDVYVRDINNTNIFTEINLQGPQGEQGQEGDGTIRILGGVGRTPIGSTFSHWLPNVDDLSNFINDINYKNNQSDIQDRSDFIFIGRGDNTLLLGNYQKIFIETSPLQWDLDETNIKGWPSTSSFIPKLLSIQENSQSHNITLGRFNGDELKFGEFYDIDVNNIIVNNFDVPELLISGKTDKARIKIGYTNDHFLLSNFIDVKSSTSVLIEGNSQNNIIKNNSNSNFITTDSGISLNALFSPKNFRAPMGASAGSDFGDSSVTLISGNINSENTSDNHDVYKDKDNVLVLTNYRGNLDSSSRVQQFSSSFLTDLSNNSNNNNLPTLLGQTIKGIKTFEMDEGQPDSGGPTRNVNLSYLGSGNPSIIFYNSNLLPSNGTSMDINPSGNNSIESLIPEENNQFADNILGYDIHKPLGKRFGGYSGFSPWIPHSIQLVRSIIHPFRGLTDGEHGTVNKVIDKVHKMMPTGSLDLFGTLRIREQEEVKDGKKDGYVAINKKDGIVGWEHASNVNAVPPGAIIMFSEVSGDKFSFFAQGGVAFGGSYSPLDINPGASGPRGTFIGKGSQELRDYWICNGAVLADERDIWITGAYNKDEFYGIVGRDVNNVIKRNGETISDNKFLEYEENDKFVPVDSFSEVYNSDDFKIKQMPNMTIPTGDGQPVLPNYLELLNTSGVFTNINEGTCFRSFGYSIPAPDNIESGWRFVLPNYFGKFPKMVFPSSAAIPSLFQYDAQGFYNDNNEYQAFKFSMSSAFDNIGSPYIQKENLPDLSHAHDTSELIITEYEHSHGPGTLNITSSGAHSHSSINYRTHDGGSATVNNVRRMEGNSSPQDSTTTNWSVPPAGSAHTHPQGSFAGNTANSTNTPKIEGQIGTGDPVGNTTYYDASDSNTFFSNFVPTGQKFFEPPFKGTYFAINLKGIRNPKRGNSIVNKFHVIGGLPLNGSGEDSASRDLSWYNLETNPIGRLKASFSHPYHIEYKGTTIVDITINWSKYGFKRMGRNDNHSHPYTIYNTNITSNVFSLTSSEWRAKINFTNGNGDDNTSNFTGHITD